jgi:hypothetical protein
VYFWNKQNSALVPDLRYLALTTAPETRASRLVGWLTKGPSRWLLPVVQPLPEQTIAEDSVTQGADKTYVVNLSAQADPVVGGPGKLHTQLAWTLAVLNGPAQVKVALRIASEDKDTEIDFRLSSPAALQVERPSRYGVVDGAVFRIKSGSDRDLLPLPDAEELRSGVAAVAFSKEERAVAVVRREGAKQRLWIGPANTIVRTDLVGSSMSQPIWLDQGDKVALVLVDGRLYQVGSSGVLKLVESEPGTIQSFSVAPDSRRIALVMDGILNTGVLNRSGGSVDSPITMTHLRAVPTTLRHLQQVTFTQENRLAIAGERDGKVSLSEITVDGVVVTSIELSYAGSLKITRLLSYPDNPYDGEAIGPILFEIDNVGYEAYPRSSPRELSGADLVAPPTPSPSSSASPSSTPTPVTVTAPSFQG